MAGLLLLLPLAHLTCPLPEVGRRHLVVLLFSLALFLAVGTRPAEWRGGRLERRRRELRLGLFFAAGVVATAFAGRLPPNELAGVVVLFVPPAVAVALTPATGTGRRLVGVLLALLFAGTLALTGSRSGLVAAAGGLLVTLLPLGRRGFAVAGGGLVAAGAAFLAAPRGFLELLVFDHKIVGLTFYSLLSGRPHVWDRALHALADFPFFGLGLGSSGPAIGELYPYSRFAPGVAYDDAHDLYLQTALDLGVPGLALFLLLVALAGRRLLAAHRRSRPGTPERLAVLGLAGALSAHLLFGLVDSVSLGTPGSLPFWLLLGLVFALEPPPARRRPGVARRRWRSAPFAIAAVATVLAVALLLAPAASRLLRLNLATATAARALLAEPALLADAATRLDAAGAESCRAAWLAGWVAEARGHDARRDAHWRRLLRCAPGRIDLVRAAEPASRELASVALAAHPESAPAHFWLARALVEASRGPEATARAVELFRRGLELAPRDGKAWLHLGELLAGRDPGAALHALARACRLGDPQGAACYNAGRLAERAGDAETALRYYRRSRLWLAHWKAADLERGTDRE